MKITLSAYDKTCNFRTFLSTKNKQDINFNDVSFDLFKCYVMNGLEPMSGLIYEAFLSNQDPRSPQEFLASVFVLTLISECLHLDVGSKLGRHIPNAVLSATHTGFSKGKDL